ncbi:Stage V sporulation protein B [Lachnospiraceae bacterium TWA4]|nr:Stage V sporulation protein B [Lachnospiraceae bacterium TWA4]
MKQTSHPILLGTLLLASSNLLTRGLGFIYRIWLSRMIGPTGMGLYQLTFPILGTCYALCCAPIQLAISKFTAETSTKTYYYVGLILSLSLSSLCAIALWQGSSFISTYFLLEERCNHLLKLLALSLPFNSIHSCICGYYLGKQKTGIPAFAQLIEQSARMIYFFFIASSFTVTTAIWALIVGEMISSLFCILTMVPSKSPYIMSFKPLKPMVYFCLPIVANRTFLSILQSIEAVMIPNCLEKCGYSSTEALSVYGVFSGMAMPFILFPTAIVGALSMMILPEIAKNHSDITLVHKTASRSRYYSLLLGVSFTCFFYIAGPFIGKLFFPSTQVGTYLQLLSFICPFLYLNNTYSSILNGLGKTSTTFSHQLVGIILRLISIIFFVPSYGILGYLGGILLSQLITCLLSHIYLRQIL